MEIASIPEWLATAILAAALATLGFVGKQFFEWIAAIRLARRARRARLVTLLSSLRGSAAIFRVQGILRNQLVQLIVERKPELEKQVDRGYEALLVNAFPTMTAEERDLHRVIRAYTVGGLRPLNEGMITWLQSDTEFKLGRRSLARELEALEVHLLMWQAKYAAWIPDTPAHALVYLADEEGHGVPFPSGIQRTIEQALGLSEFGGGDHQTDSARN